MRLYSKKIKRPAAKALVLSQATSAEFSQKPEGASGIKFYRIKRWRF
jgi:hypothetical protein